MILVVALLYLIVGAFVPHMFTPKKRKRPEATTHLNQRWREGPRGDVVDRVQIISHPRDAYNVRIALIRAATRRVDVTYYAISSQCGHAFLSELLRAADRGVHVRVLVDAKMGSMHRATRRVMARHPNVEMAIYNPVRVLQPWTLNEVLHDKFMVVDGRYALLGGRNVEPYFFDLAGPIFAVKYDWDVLVKKDSDAPEGESVVDAIEAYNELLWSHKRVRRIRPRIARRDREARLHHAWEKMYAEHPDYFEKDLDAYTRDMIRPDRIMLLHNPLTTCRKDPWIAQDLTSLVKDAERDLFVQTPYSTASPRLLDLLRAAAERVPVTFLTNSLRSAKNPPAYPNYYYQRRRFLKTGIDIYEYQDFDSIHGKAFMVDERVVAVGSFNLDSRSIYLDTETMLVIDSAAFAKSFMAERDRLLAKSLRVGENNRYEPSDTVERARSPLIKHLLYFGCYVVLRPFQYFM